jgi:hypothetical protein
VTNGVAYDIAPDAASGVFGLNRDADKQINAPTLLIGQGSGAAVAGSIEFDQDFVWPNTLNLQTTGAVTVTQQSVFAVPGPGVLSGVAGSVNLTGTAFTNVAKLGSFQVTAGDFDLSQGTPLTVMGPLSANNINLTALGNTAGITVTGPVTAAGGNLVLAAGDQGITLQSPLTVGTLDLSATAGGVTQTAGGAINATMLQSSSSVAGTVALTDGTNSIANLSRFTVTGGDFALSNGSNAVRITGPIGAVGHTLTLNAGPIAQTAGGAITAGTLAGSSSGAVDLSAASNTIPTLGPFTVTGSTFVLNDAGPLTIAGPVSAQYLAITARDQVTLSGTIATLGLPAAQQSGTQPASPGSYISVLPGGSGSGRFETTGLAALVPLGAAKATVRIDVPGNGGQIVFDPPFAPQVSLVLDTGVGGRSSGTLNVGGLLVLGSGGSATLFGTVAGFGGFGAATVSQISPRVDLAYTINSCPIGSAACLLTQNALLALIAQVSAAANPAIAADNLTSKSVVAAPLLPAPFGGASDEDGGDLVPPNISTVDY